MTLLFLVFPSKTYKVPKMTDRPILKMNKPILSRKPTTDSQADKIKVDTLKPKPKNVNQAGENRKETKPESAPNPKVQARKQTLDRLKKLFPLSLGKELPLAIGIDKQIPEIEGISKKAIRCVLHWYCSRSWYHQSILNNSHRFNLDGTASDLITDEHRIAAQQQLKESRIRKAKKAA